jgi:hypothetical protein
VPAQQGLAQAMSGTILVRGVPTQVEVAIVGMFPGAEGIRTTEVEPRSKDASGGDASAPMSPRGLGTCLPGDATLGDMILAPESSNIVDPGAIKLGVPSYPCTPPPSANWLQVEGVQSWRVRGLQPQDDYYKK